MPAPFVAPDDDSQEGIIAHMATELRRQRLKIAGLAKGLAYRELDGRTLKENIEVELRAAGANKTDAEKGAKTDPRYLKHVQDTADFEHRKAVAEAIAETARLLIQARLAILTAEVL